MKKTNWKQIGIGFLLIALFYLIVPQILGYIYGLIFSLEKPIHVIIASLLSYIIMMVFLIFYYRDSLKEEASTFLLHKKELLKISFLTWFKALLFMMIANLIVIQIAGDIASNESTNRSRAFYGRNFIPKRV